MFFNKDWYFYKVGHEEEKRLLNLPHDAMLEERRDINNPSSVSGAYFEGNDYVYEKDFDLDLKPEEKVYFHFEGIYRNGKVYLNDTLACARPYGYTDFLFDATEFVHNGTNHIKVIAENKDQPNSRWYSGAGIYRNVSIYHFPKLHLIPRSIRVKTEKDYSLSLSYLMTVEGTSTVTLKDRDGNIVFYKEENAIEVKEHIVLENPHLWSDRDPYLYTLEIRSGDLNKVIQIGIRYIEWSVEKGFLVNGERTMLFGCCVHSDNELLGAASYLTSEYRKAKLLKDNGFNAIRSSHNPISEEFLKACDELGLYVLDEYVDMWYIHKTQYDYAPEVEKNYKQDMLEMVEKDYNHASVIMYSTGNEVGETSFKKGIEWTKMFTDYLHSLDDTRPVTCGVNVFFNGIAHTPFAQYSDKKAESTSKPKKEEKVKEGGSSAFFNNLAGMMGADFMKTGAKLPIVDRYTKEAFANMDIAGYNYGIKRYKHDLKKYPNRLICGTETFSDDAPKFYYWWKKNPRVIGDFVWAGIDYIGEVGLGSYLSTVKKDYREDKSAWLLADTGMLDILGNKTAQMDLMRVGLHIDTIAIGVYPPQEYKKPRHAAAWRCTASLESWNYPGQEGNKCEVEVFCNTPYVELYLNNKKIGSKKVNPMKDFVTFKVKYQPGELKAVALDKDKKKVEEKILHTSTKDATLHAEVEQLPEKYNEFKYIKFTVCDEDGVLDPMKETKIRITEIENGTLLALGSALPHNKEGFLVKECETYYGHAQAIVRPNGDCPIVVHYESDYGPATITL